MLTEEGLATFNKNLLGGEGVGLVSYNQAAPGSRRRLKSFRGGIRIQVSIAGEYPGDGKSKPVGFPEPSAASTETNGVRFVTLEKLIELKLASGMSAPDRLKDLADVQELIKVRDLEKEFAERLDPYVRDKFLELLESCQNRLR